MAYSVIALFAFWLRFTVSSTRAIGFDEAWDIFVSRQSLWIELFRAVAATSHPAGFYSLLHLVASVGAAQLFDPLLSVLCGVVAVIFVGKVLNACGCSRWAEYSGMLICAVSQTQIAISVIVRPYSFANCLMLVSLYYGIRWLRGSFLSRGDSALFFTSLFLAFFGHFSALIYGAALTGALASLFLADQGVRTEARREFWPLLPSVVRRHIAAPLCAALFCLYLILSSQGGLFVTKSLLATQDPLQLTPYRYLKEFIYSSSRAPLEFLSNTLRSEFNLFSALQIQSSLIVVVILMLLVGGMAFLASKSRASGRRGSFLVFMLPLWCLGILLALSLLGKYPFGGELRQQSFLFPFILLALVAAADALPMRQGFRVLVWGALVLLPAIPTAILPLDDSEFGKLVPFKKVSAILESRTNVYAGTWTAFTLYGQNRDWRLEFDKRTDTDTSYILERDGVRSRLFIDRQVYFDNYAAGDLAARVRALMERENLAELYVVGFPLGRIRCKICDKKRAQSLFAESLGADEFEVIIQREKTKNGEGFALVRRIVSTPQV